MSRQDVRRQDYRNQVATEIAEIDLRQIAQDLHGKEYRDAYLDSSLCWILRTQVRLIREDRGWTQEELAEKAGLAFATINRLENLETTDSDYAPQIGTLCKIADAFDVALIVRFEAWSDYLTWIADVKARGVDALIPRPFPEDAPRLQSWSAQ